jgi:hypothetical protein
MLALENYIQKAHRLDRKVAASVTRVEPGQLFQINDQNEFEYADGTKKAYPTYNNRYNGTGYGAIQGELNEGRDDVSRTGRIVCFKGNYEIGTDMYDKDASYASGTPLHPSTVAGKKGQVTPYDAANPAHKAHFIIGYVTYVPADDTDFLRYEG